MRDDNKSCTDTEKGDREVAVNYRANFTTELDLQHARENNNKSKYIDFKLSQATQVTWTLKGKMRG